jgi:low affinity Fe/Cu permease
VNSDDRSSRWPLEEGGRVSEAIETTPSAPGDGSLARRPRGASRGRRGAFQVVAQSTSTAVGSAWAFIAATGLVLVWAAAGPFFGFSDAWQLAINTSTTISTFLMVFLIQNTQNRDARAMHLKLDELVRSLNEARNDLIDVEQADDATVALLKQELRDVHGANQ